MFNRKPRSRKVGQAAVLRDSDLHEQQKQLTALSPSVVSATAAQQYAKAIADGQNETNRKNAEPLVKNYRDGGRNDATDSAGLKQNESRDNTTPRGRDGTRDNRRTGEYAAAIGDSSNRKQSKGRYAKGDNS